MGRDKKSEMLFCVIPSHEGCWGNVCKNFDYVHTDSPVSSSKQARWPRLTCEHNDDYLDCIVFKACNQGSTIKINLAIG